MKNPSEETPARWESLPSWLLTQTANHAHRLVADGFSSVRARGYHYRLLATLEEFGPASQAAQVSLLASIPVRTWAPVS